LKYFTKEYPKNIHFAGWLQLKLSRVIRYYFSTGNIMSTHFYNWQHLTVLWMQPKKYTNSLEIQQ